MKNKNYATGKVGFPRTTRFHRTMKEAEARIARAQKKDPDGVYRGDYYIDSMKAK